MLYHLGRCMRLCFKHALQKKAFMIFCIFARKTMLMNRCKAGIFLLILIVAMLVESCAPQTYPPRRKKPKGGCGCYNSNPENTTILQTKGNA